jgi:transposase-like protein
LAERFEGHPDSFYPWRLRFQLSRKGRPPTDRLRAAADQLAIVRLVNKALAQPHKNLKAAVGEVSKQIGLSEATVRNAYYAEMKKDPSYK